ncbi:MAG: imidazolonepropionase [Saprospiraceae bacterium]
MILLGPFTQLLTLANLPTRGPLSDDQLEIITDAGVVYNGELNNGGTIVAVGSFEELQKQYPAATVNEVKQPAVALPGLIDCHTHLCWAGSRAQDFAMRNSGATYLEMAAAGGGIKTSVAQTRAASDETLVANIAMRLEAMKAQGITTAEVKSGYGLSVAEEMRHLNLIAQANESVAGIDVVSTCLAAHVCPPEFAGKPEAYLETLTNELLPKLKAHAEANGTTLPRIDAFAEPSTFWGDSLEAYMTAAKAHGFSLTLHADQFTPGGAALGVKLGADSVDHLEHSDASSIAALSLDPRTAGAEAATQTVAVALPGASIGLGEPFTPSRKLLDAGAILAIATDWNPGSGPQGNLVGQASILASAQKLSNAEVLAGITTRAARALSQHDRVGILAPGMAANISMWPTNDYREITWLMGSMKPLLPTT